MTADRWLSDTLEEINKQLIEICKRLHKSGEQRSMKFNLKNRPKPGNYYIPRKCGDITKCGDIMNTVEEWFITNTVEEWFEGFEKELRERLKVPFKDCITVKEILGE